METLAGSSHHRLACACSRGDGSLAPLPPQFSKLWIRDPACSFWIPTYCSWKKGCPAQPQLLSSQLPSKSPRTCTTRGASWWMSMRVECWNFWGWGIVCLCLGFWRWDCFSLNFICRESATSVRIPCIPGRGLWSSISFPTLPGGKCWVATALGSVRAWSTPLLNWPAEIWLSSLSPHQWHYLSGSKKEKGLVAGQA